MAEKRSVRLLVVDDSLFFLALIQRGLKDSPEIEVVGAARSAREAEEKILALAPDVVTLDVEMPGESGFDFLKRFLKTRSLPFVLVSSLDVRLFDALSAGAVDYVKKPSASSETDMARFIHSLESKILIARMAKVRTTPARSAPAAPAVQALKKLPPPDTVVFIGASTGGTEATAEILMGLPENMPPILVVQHMPAGFTKMYAERLDRSCRLRVREAANGDRVEPGTVYVAPGGFQMTLGRLAAGSFYLQCTDTEKRSGHVPSVDSLFLSGAACVGARGIGILLTGMGRDGAEGLLAMRRKGAFTIAQDEATSVVYGMPGEAKKLGAVTVEAPCGAIAGRLIEYLNR